MEQTNISEAKLQSVIESLLLISSKPLMIREVQLLFPQLSQDQLLNVFELIKVRFQQESSGIELVALGGGYQLRTVSENNHWIVLHTKAKPVKLSRSSLETLAIVAYRQPITRPEIDEIRGVDSGYVLRTLLERNLIKILGKREEPGNPLIYGTTSDFLHFFQLNSLSDLPSLKEYSELGADSLKKLEQLYPKVNPDTQTNEHCVNLTIDYDALQSVRQNSQPDQYPVDLDPDQEMSSLNQDLTDIDLHAEETHST